MDRKLINPSIVSGIADAVRAKGKTTEPIKVADLPEAIMNLPEGGGVGETTEELLDAVGVESREDTGMANGLAIALTDAPLESSWSGERATADGAPIKDGVAFVSALKGKTMKVNQMMENGNFEQPRVPYQMASYLVSLSFSANKVTMTVTSSAINIKAIKSQNSRYKPLGHKCIVIADLKYTSSVADVYGMVGFSANNGAIFYENRAYPDKSGVTKRSWSIYTITADVTYVEARIRNQAEEGDTLDVSNWMFFDLTEMGMEDVTSADEFAQRLGYKTIDDLPYIPYTPTTNLQSFAPKAIVSKGRNLWDEEWESGIWWPITTGNKPKKAANANPYIRTANPIPIKGGRTLHFSFGDGTDRNVALLNAEGVVVAYKSIAHESDIVAPDDAVSAVFYVKVNSIYENNICVNYTDSMDGTYTPYREPSRLDFDLTTIVDSQGNQLFPDGELKSAGSVHDLVDYANNVAVRGKKMIGRVDMGELTWIKQTVTEGAPIDRYTCTTLTTKASGFLNLVCAKFAVDQKIFDTPLTAKPNCICGRSNNQYIYVSTEIGAYANGASFKSAMQGVYLDYELAEPIEGEAPLIKSFYPIQSNGSEEAITDTIVPFNGEIRCRVDTESLLTQSASLLRYSNEVTGANDSSLGNAVKTLTDSYK